MKSGDITWKYEQSYLQTAKLKTKIVIIIMYTDVSGHFTFCS